MSNDANIFEIIRIKKVASNENLALNSSVFSTDSGLIVFVLESSFLSFVSKFNYYNLIETATDIINKSYWNSLAKNYTDFEIGLVIAPGINCKAEFEGSGTYKIV